MRRLIPALVAALFAAVTFSAYAADDATTTAPPAKQSKSKKKKAKAPPVGQSANPMDKSGQGAPQSSGAGGVQAGAPAAEGRGTPSGQPAAGGGGVTSPTPKGAGRADNQ
jgi:hypothetical protein